MFFGINENSDPQDRSMFMKQNIQEKEIRLQVCSDG